MKKTGRLVKESSNKNNMRTKEIVGEYDSPPTPGESFVIQGPPLDKGYDFRTVATSKVKHCVWSKDSVLFKTMHSEYTLYFDENLASE